MNILGIIPARYDSTRFPGKPLVIIDGKSMIQRVYEQALKAQHLQGVWVATDDERIYKHVANFGGNVVMTASSHPSGTDRCYEAITKIMTTDKHLQNIQAVINIQGDEPYIYPEQIDELASLFAAEKVQIGTLVKVITKHEELFNPSTAKVVLNQQKEAQYFSRQPLPYLRNFPAEDWIANHTFYKHIGIYGYRIKVLQKITQLPQAPTEKAECLEQLRWLFYGFKVHTYSTQYPSTLAIDTPEDLVRLEVWIATTKQT